MKRLQNRILPCLFAVIFVTSRCPGQPAFSIGAKGGISIPNLKSSGNNPVSKGWSSRLGPNAGIVAELQVSENLFLQAELNYASQGGKKNGVQAIPSSNFSDFIPPGTPVPSYLYGNYFNEAKLNYIELPVLLKLDFPVGETLSLFINAGPYGGYLVNAKNVSSGTSNIYFDENLSQPLLPENVSFDETRDIKEDLKKFNCGIQAGIGVSLTFYNENKLLLTGGGNYGLIAIQKNKENGKNVTGAATITLTYLINLFRSTP